MAIGANQRIRHSHLQPARICRRIVTKKNTAGQKLEVHLMHDAYGWRHDAKVFKCLLTPSQKLIAFGIAQKLYLDVFPERVRRPKEIDLY